MLELNLAGQPYTMGLQHADQVAHLKGRIRVALDAFLTAAGLDGTDRNDVALFDRYLGAHASSTWEMYRGIVDGLGFDWDDMAAYALRNYLASRAKPEGCTVVAESRPGSDSPLLAKTRDYYHEHEPIQLVGSSAGERVLRFVFMGSAGSPGVFGSGMNEAGLAVADNHVPTTDIGIGLPSYALMQGLLESCHNVEEGVAYLESVTHMGSTNLTLVDPDGRMAVCESAHSGPRIRQAVRSFEVSTNHFTDLHLAEAWGGSQQDKDESIARKERMSRHMQAESDVTVGQVVSLLSSHDDGATCRHGEDDGYRTILTAIYSPASRSLRFSAGLPCTGKWASLDLLTFLGRSTR